MKSLADAAASLISEQEQHNPRLIGEAHDFREADFRAFADALNHGNKGPGKWTKGSVPKHRDKIRKLEQQPKFDLRSQRNFTYTNKSGNNIIADVTVAIMAHFDTQSKGSARIYIFSKDHPDGVMVSSYNNSSGAVTQANQIVRKALDASNQAYLDSLA